MKNILDIKNRNEFRNWLINNSTKETECFIEVKKGKPVDDGALYYLDMVEEAICFGWIDSTYTIINNIRYQRFSPRTKNSPWTELNKERARRLIKLNLMRPEGKKVLPNLGKRSFKIDPELIKIFKEKRIYSKFKSFPKLYQNIRCYNLMFYKKLDKETYEKALNFFVLNTKKGLMYGQWNDYGRLLEY